MFGWSRLPADSPGLTEPVCVSAVVDSPADGELARGPKIVLLRGVAERERVERKDEREGGG